MSALPAWKPSAFGCIREGDLVSLLRTQLSASLPAPFVSRKADTSAPVELTFSLDMTDAGFRAWQQWFTYDLLDGSLAFTMFIPWGTLQRRVRARLVSNWQAQRRNAERWQVSGTMQIERESLPRFSGGINSQDTLPGTWYLQPQTAEGFTGFRSGLVEAPNHVGTLTPPTMKGAVWRRLQELEESVSTSIRFQVQLAGTLPQDFFHTITLCGHTFNTADAMFGAPALNTLWSWDTAPGIVAGVTTPVEVT